MKTKTKLNLAVGLLLLMILLLTTISAWYIFAIKKDTDNILKANYNTLEYSRNMLGALDDFSKDRNTASIVFEQNLEKQLGNISEKGEEKVTIDLKRNFEKLKGSGSDEIVKAQIRSDIFEIMKLNMSAIKVKGDLAKRTADTANLWIAIAGTFCFLIAFNLMINLPENIANPIRELTDSIREIAKGNYTRRVHFKNRNEFGDLARSFNTMAEKLQEYNNSNLNKLLVEKKRIETLLDNMHDPVIGLDKNGIILSANDQALRILGLKVSDVVGKDAEEVAGRNDLMRSLLSEATNKKAMKIYADGKESYFEPEKVNIRVVPTGENDVADIGNFIILRNITAFKELDFAKTNFIATVSHELKTPISAIKLSLKLLEKENTGTTNAEQKQLLESIKDDSDRLLKITGELLEMSQVETGNIQLTLESCSPSEIIESSLDAVRTQADEKQLELKVELPDTPVAVRADAAKTSWVLNNLLTNAIRYAPESSVLKVDVKVSDSRLFFSVTDKGQGIDEKYQARIFDRYFQVPGSSKTGTGLGLAISREFIEAQSGEMGVESSVGNGSTFWFWLPQIES
ncbi:sensor histidine kinase [Flavobacterium silvaticum]|uniref:histidine kinase n=1 Tax=Flavobacterium silvaticum TaxID=1852020 RepID=A0A972FP14_9FLAO|nr:ATP-binding protein [Flavobacterium silvaticum]NMH28780.1 HAMP domain-containing protein [Flavobacterium silvaticum]